MVHKLKGNVGVWDFMCTMKKLVIGLGDGLFWIGSK
jgi:hypothetical protein